MAFPDPENIALEGEVNGGKIAIPAQTPPSAINSLKIVFSEAQVPRQFSLEGQVVFPTIINCPSDSDGGDCDDRPGTGMLYPRG